MKKYIGFILGVMFSVIFAVSCSGAFGFDESNSGIGGENPFDGTKWENSDAGITLSFSSDSCEITSGVAKSITDARATTSGTVSNGSYDYTWKVNADGSFTATLKIKSSNTEYATFRILSSGAGDGALRLETGVTYTCKKKTSMGGTSDKEETDKNEVNRFEIKDGTLIKYTRIGAEAEIVIPDDVTIIGAGVFSGCNYLKKVTIPITVESIERNAFSGCDNMLSIIYKGGHEDWSRILFYYSIQNDYTTVGDGTGMKGKRITCNTGNVSPESSIWRKTISGTAKHTEGMCIEAYRGNKTDIKIPKGATSIASNAFSSTKITSIVIPNTVTSIGENAFGRCFELTNIVIPDSVTSIDRFAFYYCNKLESVTLSNNLTSITERMFCKSENLLNITIPGSVKEICYAAFEDCTNLESVTISEGVTSINDDAFAKCKNLKSVIIPEGVTSIGSSAFMECLSLTEVTIPVSVKSIGLWAFGYCESLESITYGGTEKQWNDIKIDDAAGLNDKKIIGKDENGNKKEWTHTKA